MGRLRSRLEKLERLADAYRDEITLPDGRTLTLGPGDRLNTLLSLLGPDEEEQHWLVDAILDQYPAGEELPQEDEFVQIILALGGGTVEEESP